MVAVPQESVALGASKVQVLVHSTILLGAQMTGGVESRTVMRWTQVLWLLQSSVARHVRSIKFTVRPGPGMPGGCGGGFGGGPRGGCCCGAGSGLILFALIEIVLLPMETCSGGLRNLKAESSCAAMPPPTCPGAVDLSTIQISTKIG